MFGYIVRRVIWIVPVLFAVSLITFTFMHAAPGGPWAREKNLPARTVELLNEKYGLNDPVPVQYLRWVGGLVTGDLGPSYKYQDRSVNDIVGDGIGTTVHLGLMAFGLSVLVGIPLGVIGALRHNKIPDYLATFISVIGIATPSFVAAILLLVFFSVALRWFPTHGWDGWENPGAMVLPTLALALFPIAQISRFTRASMLEVTRKDYVRTAQSKGLKERTIVSIHMIRNALIPVVTILGPVLAFLITGSFIIETIFSVPGIGRFYVISISSRDYGVIMAMTVLYAAVIAVLNLVVDVLYAYIDPRIRYS
ncbi:MAG TPA: ABC transporter permease [Candidatus Limnocylindria bacterium]|nr:ABC transporter permease [Candidatus Limnocylindria bacterium]